MRFGVVHLLIDHPVRMIGNGKRRVSFKLAKWERNRAREDVAQGGPCSDLTAGDLKPNPPAILSRHNATAKQGGKMPLTAVWIIYGIVRDADGASIELAFRRDIWYATRNFRPQRLAFGVILEKCSGLPYRWEFMSGLGHGRIVICGALRVRIWGVICEWQSAMTKCGCKG